MRARVGKGRHSNPNTAETHHQQMGILRHHVRLHRRLIHKQQVIYIELLASFLRVFCCPTGSFVVHER
jgi:hypothetical protein